MESKGIKDKMREAGTYQTRLTEKSKAYAEEILGSMQSGFIYHNLEHTRQVARAAEEIGKQSKLDPQELENVIVAAWFHDLGYHKCIQEHEKESVKLMREKLSEWNVDKSRIRAISEIILATQMPQKPKNLMCKIICDADLYHLADPEFIHKSENLRKEINRTCNKQIDSKEWTEMNLEFISRHCYFTEYAKNHLSPKKDMIIRNIKNRIRQLTGC